MAKRNRRPCCSAPCSLEPDSHDLRDHGRDHASGYDYEYGHGRAGGRVRRVWTSLYEVAIAEDRRELG